jgi:hypothetical protein
MGVDAGNMPTERRVVENLKPRAGFLPQVVFVAAQLKG